MKPTTPSGENIISISPSSILRERLKTHEADYHRCVEKLPELLQQVEEWNSESYPDPLSIRFRKDVKQIWLLQIEGYTLLVDLCNKIDENPFPGQKLMVTKVAVRLSPDVGRFKWLAIFEVYDIEASLRLYFPAEAVEFDLQSLEQQLLELAGDRDIVPVAETREVLPWGPTSKTYQNAKEQLQKRGWAWKSVRCQSKVTKVICVPKV